MIIDEISEAQTKIIEALTPTEGYAVERAHAQGDERLAMHDGLTGLSKPPTFVEAMEREAISSDRAGSPLLPAVGRGPLQENQRYRFATTSAIVREIARLYLGPFGAWIPAADLVVKNSAGAGANQESGISGREDPARWKWLAWS